MAGSNQTAEIGDYRHHHESSRTVGVSAEALFAYLDDHDRLSGHMSRRSWMMAGSRMAVELDAEKGKAVGSRIVLKGSVLGIPLSVEETVTARTPPLRKAWQTVGTPKLLVIGSYRMGFEVVPANGASSLRIFIDYDLPGGRMSRWLARVLGHVYARWCTDMMANDAVRHFSTDESARASR